MLAPRLLALPGAAAACAVVVVFAVCVSAHVEDVGPAADEWLAVDFSVAGDQKPAVHDGTVFACTRLVLRPEDGGQRKSLWEVTVRVQHRAAAPATSSQAQARQFEAAETKCAAAGGTLASLDKLQSFVNAAVSGDEEPVDACDAEKGSELEPSDSPLAHAVAEWNNRFFNLDSAVTRQNADRFHSRGMETKHLAQEVTHFVMPTEVQARINARLATHRGVIFGDEGAGQGGTTGAHFLAGNVGFGNPNQGSNIMEMVFSPDPTTKNPVSILDLDLFSGTESERRRGGMLYGEAPLGGVRGGGGATSESSASLQAPDLTAFEKEIHRLLLKRSDVNYLFGNEVEMQWQHRLWRYGPNFDPKAKGGIWHKDTCPFGINGALPENSIMFTIVYILYTENLDGPTAGTRVKDDDGTSISLPCVAGEGNIIRSGESDDNAFYHSGPLNIRKLDSTRPAYRVMLQSKVLVRPVGGRQRAIPSKGNWRGLKLEPLVFGDAMEPVEKVGALQQWLHHTSERLTAGVGESNAVGFEAYPVNVGRAWAVTADLCTFLGLQTVGLLPEPSNPATPAVIFGWDQRYTESIVSTLTAASFRVLNVASDGDFAELRRTRQETYSNLDTADIDSTEEVAAKLGTYPYDFHVVIDVPPFGERALGKEETVITRYGSEFASLAAKSAGEGRLATITLLSQQMPIGGRDSAGKETVGGPLSKVQAAFLKMERDLVEFGDANNVRVVILRVADRVYTPSDSALSRVSSADLSANPCRVEQCSQDEPVTRIHSEDLSLVLRRMLAMFDFVDTHGKDSSMKGSAAMDVSITRFPSGTVLEVVDDGLPDTMLKTYIWASAMMGNSDVCESSCANNPAQEDVGSMPSHRNAKGRNADLKDALGMPSLRYPTYHHGAAKMFGAGEF